LVGGLFASGEMNKSFPVESVLNSTGSSAMISHQNSAERVESFWRRIEWNHVRNDSPTCKS
jgi:hypothetical protein